MALALLAFGYTGLLETAHGKSDAGSCFQRRSGSCGGRPRGDGPCRAENPSGLPAVRESELPADARKTLALIRAGGPYPVQPG